MVGGATVASSKVLTAKLAIRKLARVAVEAAAVAAASNRGGGSGSSDCHHSSGSGSYCRDQW